MQACAEAGTHYFDLSVETDMHTAWAAVSHRVLAAWLHAGARRLSATRAPDAHAPAWLACMTCCPLAPRRRPLQRYGEEAAESGALICHACGQDHVLADFGALLVRAAPELRCSRASSPATCPRWAGVQPPPPPFCSPAQAARLFSAPGERLESVAGVLQALPGARLVLRCA